MGERGHGAHPDATGANERPRSGSQTLTHSTHRSIGVLSPRLTTETPASLNLAGGSPLRPALVGQTRWDMIDDKPTELALVEERLWVVSRRTGLAVYDFDFSSAFRVRHPAMVRAPITAVARLGAVEDYSSVFEMWRSRGVEFINNPEDVSLADDLSKWYPRLQDVTPKSVVFDSFPAAAQIDAAIGWPVFLKGVRQTNRHDASLAIARSATDLERIASAWSDNPILAPQRVAARAFIPLRPIERAGHENKLQRSFEFRTFWWRGQLVGAGPYWTDCSKYEWNAREQREALMLAGEAARRIDVGFLCVDVAQTAQGQWIVIEVNDAQRSGYAGVPPIALWRRVIELQAADHGSMDPQDLRAHP